MKLVLLSVLLNTLGKVVGSEKCVSAKCCWVDMPDGYCDITLPTDPMNVMARFFVKNLDEVDETKLSYTFTIG